MRLLRARPIKDTANIARPRLTDPPRPPVEYTGKRKKERGDAHSSPNAMVPAMSTPATTATQRAYVNLTPGDPAPWFTQRLGEDGYAIHRAAGRYIMLCFFASASNAAGQAAMAVGAENPRLFDDGKASFFGVSLDRGDVERLSDS